MDIGRFFIGTSGWAYRSWHGDFYPREVKAADELRYLAGRTTATEINASFYRLQRPESYRRWRDATPAEHVFAVKGSRYVTHLKQLREPRTALANLLASGVLQLGPKLGVMLWQLPAILPFDDRVADFLSALPRTLGEAAALAAEHDERLTEDRVAIPHRSGADPQEGLRHALEPRHPSFGSAEAAAALAENGVALVWSDSPGSWPTWERDTAPFRYVRLHGHSRLYTSRYSDRSLDAWAERCRAWSAAGEDVHVYFDNDANGHAPHDAARLLGRLTPLERTA